MTISYTEDGEVKTYVVREHGTLSLPENKTPSLEKPKKETKKHKKFYPLDAHDSEHMGCYEWKK